MIDNNTINYRLKDAIEYGMDKLKDSSPSPRLDVDLMLCKVMDFDRMKLMMSYDKPMHPEEIKEFERMLEQRSMRKPIAYIINEKEFMGLNFYVKENVLIPRPDTEIIVEEVLDIIDRAPKEGENGPIKVMDMCLGSGAIALSIAKLSSVDLQICGVDISKEAIDVARVNRRRLGLGACVDFVESDLFSSSDLEVYLDSLDILVSNPPYIEDHVIEGLEPDVKDYEPILALAGGDDGMDFYKSIIKSSPKFLKIGGWLVFESGHDQAEKIKNEMEKVGFDCLYFKKDLQGYNRMVAGRLIHKN